MLIVKQTRGEQLIAKNGKPNTNADFGFSDSFEGVTTNRAIKKALENKDNSLIESAKEASVYNANFNNKHLKADNYLTTKQIVNPTFEEVKRVNWDVIKPLKGEGTIIEEGNTLSIKHDNEDTSLSMGVLESLQIKALQEEGGAYVTRQNFEWTDLNGPIFIDLCFREPIISNNFIENLWIEDSSNERVYISWPNDRDPIGLHLNTNAMSFGEDDNSKYAYEPNSKWKQTNECYVFFTPGIYRFLFNDGDLTLIDGQSIIKLQLISEFTTKVVCGLINGYSDGLIDAEYYLDKFVDNSFNTPRRSDGVVTFKSPIAECENEVIYRKNANCPNRNDAVYACTNFYSNNSIVVGSINKTRSNSNGFVDNRFRIYWITIANNTHVKERAWLF